jgi:glycine hydroxymethyltransferase
MDIVSLLAQEKVRVLGGINLIASENYPSSKVCLAASSILSGKYAEGYPGARYYAGCSVVDKIEVGTISLARELFGAEHANVQPHSGTQANHAVMQAILEKGDVVLSLSMDCGGHLTHGHKLNFSGRNYQFHFYGLDAKGFIDYSQVEVMAHQYSPKLIIAGGSACPRLIDFERFAIIAKSVGARLMVDMAHFAGMVAAKLIPSPVPYADVVTMTTHKTLRGPRGGIILCRASLAQALDRAVMPGTQGGPAMNIIAAKGVALQEAFGHSFVDYQKQVLCNAQVLAKALSQKGYYLVSGGTDTHLLLVDLQKTPRLMAGDMTGALAEKLLEEFNVFVNRNLVPGDLRSPRVTSGIRIGTPAITTLGAKDNEMQTVAQIIDDILCGASSTAVDRSSVEAKILTVTSAFTNHILE